MNHNVSIEVRSRVGIVYRFEALGDSFRFLTLCKSGKWRTEATGKRAEIVDIKPQVIPSEVVFKAVNAMQEGVS